MLFRSEKLDVSISNDWVENLQCLWRNLQGLFGKKEVTINFELTMGIGQIKHDDLTANVLQKPREVTVRVMLNNHGE